MVTVDSLVRRFEGVFDPRQANVLAEAIHDAYCEIVRLLVTHYARPVFLREAHQRNVIVVQSFEW
jgi:hypothetical protein